MDNKVLDWKAIAEPLDFDTKRRRASGQFASYKELMAKAWEREEAAKTSQELRKAKELELKPKLLERLVTRVPIKILKSFHNPTETLGGNTPEEEDDGFYTIIKGSASSKFQEVMETIPEGEVLQFKHLDKTLGQLIFKSLVQNKEYAIYKDETIVFQGSEITNVGLQGLMFNSDINT